MIESKSNYGVVIFDDEARPGAGWASIAGGSAFRIRGTGDLITDVYWWTNLPKSTFIKHGSLGNPRLKQDDYLKPNMTQLQQELGLSTTRMTLSRIAEVISEIFHRVMNLAEKNYGLQRPSEAALSDDLYDLLIEADKPITPEIDEALRQSYQTWASCDTRMPQSAKFITFRRPRIQHALDVLSTPIPGDQWEFVDAKRMPPESKRVEWLVNQDRPALVKAAVKNIQYEVSRVVSFGGGSPLVDRGWMSHPELLMLSKFASVRVDGAFLFNNYEPKNVYKPLAAGGAMGLLSISNGILAENYWIGLASTRSFKKFSRDKVTITSPRAVWLTASDRFYTLLPALMMDGSGFNVRGYGRGKVTIAVQRGALDDARRCAFSAGLNAPLYVHEDISIQSSLA